MPVPILMPALSPTMEEGTLAKWLVKEGDTVASGDVIAEIETDKATMEVEAVDEGTVGRILVAEGTEGVKVNAPIAVLLEEGEDAGALDGFDASAAGAQPAPQAADSASAPAPSEAAARQSAPEQPSAPAQHAASGAIAERILASPLARRIAEQANLDLSAVAGSGPNGRIVKRDVDAALEGGQSAQVIPMRGTAQPAAAQPATAQPTAAPVPQPVPATQGAQEIPLNNIRKTVAKRLTDAKRDVPHYYLTIDCEIDELLRVRKNLNSLSQDGDSAYKISVNDFVIRAAALALMQVPAVNSSFAGDKIVQHGTADIAMAVAIEDGLITPIIHNAQSKGLAQIAREAKSLAERARAKKLKPEEFQGGTFSISNLGMFGVKHFTAVINPPHAAILAVGAGEARPVIRNGEIAKATVMTCTLSCDHRAVDGAGAAPFLQVFKGYIEEPASMLL